MEQTVLQGRSSHQCRVGTKMNTYWKVSREFKHCMSSQPEMFETPEIGTNLCVCFWGACVFMCRYGMNFLDGKRYVASFNF